MHIETNVHRAEKIEVQRNSHHVGAGDEFHIVRFVATDKDGNTAEFTVFSKKPLEIEE